jgi:NAD+ kinase
MNHRFGVFVNPQSTCLQEVFDLLARWPKTDTLYIWHEQQEVFPELPLLTPETAPQAGLAAIFVFGGDGTILSSVKFALAADAPILGINVGRLGFLTECGLRETPKARDQIVLNNFILQERMLLDIVLRHDGQEVLHELALNDTVVFKGASARLIDLRLTCNRQFVLDTRCDGIVAASPTGSTAYSLSSGGPILSPVMEAMIVAPLNPHVLSVRPMVFAPRDRIGFKLLNELEGMVLQIDGHNVHSLHTGDDITVTASSRRMSFVRLSRRTFYEVLRKKLHMGIR